MASTQALNSDFLVSAMFGMVTAIPVYQIR